MTLPLSLTVMRLVARLATETCESPIVNLAVTLPLPHRPSPALQPSRFETTVTFSPTGQNDFGRKCSSLLLNQCQPPGTGTDSVTVKCKSAAARDIGLAM